MTDEKSYKEFIKESGLSRIYSKIKDHTSGSISGHRDEYTNAEGQQNNKEIAAYLKSQGYSVTKVSGNYIENQGSENEVEKKEPSFFVVNDNVEGWDDGELEKDLVRLGEAYDQDSVLVIPPGGDDAYLVGTTHRDDVDLDFGEKVTVGDGKFGKVAGEFLSRIQGREFAFEEVRPLEVPGTINGIRAMKAIAERAKQKIDSLNE